MLKKLDKYIIKKFLTTFLFVVLIFTLIAIVIDFSEKVEEYIDENLSAEQVISEYYVNFILFINGMLWPLFVLISVIFFTSRMASNSEIISMLNAGMSFRRLMLPYMVAACSIAGLHLFANHVVIPIANKEMFTFIHKYVAKEQDKGKRTDIHMFISPTAKIYVREYHKRDNIGKKFRLEQFEDNELKTLIKSERAIWKGELQKWHFTNFRAFTLNKKNKRFEETNFGNIDTAFHYQTVAFNNCEQEIKPIEKPGNQKPETFTFQVCAEKYYARDSLAVGLTIKRFDNGNLVDSILADSGKWQGAHYNWHLESYEIRTFDGKKETYQIDKKEILDTTFNLKPKDFVRYDDTKNMIPTTRLKAFVAEEKQRGIGNTKIYEIELYRRTADPVTILIVTLIGMSVASRKVRGGLGLHLALGVALGAIFIFLSRLSITIATNESLSAFVGVWIPNILFGSIAIWLIMKAQK